MKKSTSFKLLFFVSFLFFAFSVSAQSVELQVKEYLKANGYSISTEQYANLAEGEKAGHTKKFYADNSYVIVAYSEEYGVNDIDVYLYDDDGELLTKDTDNEDIAIVEYSPYFSRNMRVVIKNYDSDNTYSEYKCEFIIAFRNN